MNIAKFEQLGYWLWADSDQVRYRRFRVSVPSHELRQTLDKLRHCKDSVRTELLSRQNARAECIEASRCRRLSNCDMYPVQPGICRDRVSSTQKEVQKFGKR